MSPEIHPSAAIGFARAADAYERGRPGFPVDAVSWIVEALDLRPGRTVVDLGAGTGKLTRLFAPTGARVIAVEPIDAMRAILRREAPDAHVVGATAEALPFADGTADAAVAAQAFHWFDAPRALGQLERVLPAGAPLVLVWNVRDDAEPWVRAMTELLEPHRGSTPSHRAMRWRDAFGATRAWTAPSRRAFPYRHVTTRAATVDRAVSISFIAALPDDERRRVAAAMDALLPAGDEVVFPYRTEVWSSSRL
jgi:SAM-dependent methyltransferase